MGAASLYLPSKINFTASNNKKYTCIQKIDFMGIYRNHSTWEGRLKLDAAIVSCYKCVAGGLMY